MDKDASNYALRALRFQCQDDCVENLIAPAIRALSTSENSYYTPRRGMLALLYAVRP